MSTTALQPLAPTSAAPDGLGIWFGLLRGWHLTSLDAASVAVVWLLTFSRFQPAGVRWKEALALGTAVWLLYVSDRMLDAARNSVETLQARHLFHAEHRRRFGTVAAACGCGLVLLLPQLPAGVRAGWLWLGVPMAAYALAVHCWRVQRLPKELMVSLMFAVATMLPALVERPLHCWRTVAAGALFLVVCWLNCVAIARWEGSGAQADARSTTWGAKHLGSLCMAAGFAGFSMAPFCGMTAVAAGVSALFLLVLDRRHRQVEPVALRALADAVLLTPLVFCLVR